jgi:hypothetical protein
LVIEMLDMSDARNYSLKGGGYDSTLSFNPLEDDINSLLEGGASAGIDYQLSNRREFWCNDGSR